MSAENEIRNIKLFEEEIRNIKQMAFDAAHPVNETYTQYPQQDDPMTLYNKDGVTSVWEIQSQYSGAFFRSSNAPEAVYKADDEDEYYIQDMVTGALLPINASADGGPSISPTPSGAPIQIEGKIYQRYPVTASSRNAADYINKTNSLSVQEQKTAKNGLKGDSSYVYVEGANHSHQVLGVSGSGYTSGNVRFDDDRASGLVVAGSNDVDRWAYYWGSLRANLHGLKMIADSGTLAMSGSCTPSISSDDLETRPNNFTQVIWKRIS